MLRRRTILFITDSFVEMSGAEKNLYQIVTGLNKNRYRVIVCCLHCGELAKITEQQGIELIKLEVRKVYNLTGIKHLIRLWILVIRGKVDLIVTYHESSDFYGIFLSLTTRTPVISNRRDMGYKLKRRHIVLYRFFNPFFSKIIAVSDAVKKIIIERENTPSKKIVTVHNGVEVKRSFKEIDSKEVMREIGLNPAKPIVGMVAALRKVKGHEYFIKAASIILKRNPDIQFINIGYDAQEPDISKRQLEIFAERLGIKNNVMFVGGRSDIQKILPEIDISVLSSLSEGFSNTILESMAAGKPVVCTCVGGNPEAVIDGKTGFLVPPKDPESLAQATSVLLEDEELANTMGKTGKERAERYFSLKRMIETNGKIYEKAIENSRSQDKFAKGLKRVVKLFSGVFFYYSGIVAMIDYLQNLIPNRRNVQILTYHRVNDFELLHQLGLAVSVSNFENQIKYLSRKYNIISLKKAVELLSSKQKIPKNAMVITFDDGYRDNFTEAFPILKRYEVPFTLFLTANCIDSGKPIWIDYIINTIYNSNDKKRIRINSNSFGTKNFPLETYTQKREAIFDIINLLKGVPEDEKRKILKNILSEFSINEDFLNSQAVMLSWDEVNEMRGHNKVSFGAHGLTHAILTMLSRQKAEGEIKRSKEILKEKIGKEVEFFAYPNGSRSDFNKRIMEMVRIAGYSCGCTLISGPNNHHNFHPFSLKRDMISEEMSIGLFDRYSKYLFATNLQGIIRFFRFVRKKSNFRG